LSTDSAYSKAYCDILGELTSQGGAIHDVNTRTGQRIRVLRGARTLQVDLTRRGEVPVPGNRRVFPRTAAAEVAWFMMGTQEARWIRGMCNIWDKFIEDDGETVRGAYGYRWRNHFGRDQIAGAIRALDRDPSDRRVYVDTWDASSDGLGAEGQRNVPCPVGFHLSVLARELNTSVLMRSSDVMVGLPYDVMGFSLLTDAIAASLGLRPGVLTMALAHPHLYEAHWEMARDSLNQERFNLGPHLPGWTVQQIEEDPEAYVKMMHEATVLLPQHPFNCKPEVVV
jgi:thymidylate synthase